MKDSGIEWIGQIPEDWTTKRIKELFTEINDRCEDGNNYTLLSVSEYYGVAPKADKVAEDEMITHADSFDGYKICLPDDIVMNIMLAWKKALGVSNYIGIVSPAYCIYRSKTDMWPRYFNYLFRTDTYANLFKQHSTGIIDSRLRLYPDKFLALSCHFPDKDTQQRIADFLDEKCGKIDRYIEKQQQVIEKLKSYKQSVITEAVTKGINPDVPMKDSGIEWIGMIPEHWETPEIKYLVRIASGGTPDRNHPEYWNGNIPWIKTGELQNDIIISAEEYITDEGLNNSSAQIFDADTILVAMYGQGKTRGMTGLLKIPASTNQACAGLTVSSPSIHIQYLWQCLIGAYDAIRAEAAGSGQPNLSATLIGNFHIALPPIEEQDKIVDHIKNRTAEISSAIEKADSLLNKLIEYKKSLIYEAVTGKLEV